MIGKFIYGFRVIKESSLDWQAYKLEPDVLIFGTERYAQFVWTVEVKPNVIETDPGPLDAKVP